MNHPRQGLPYLNWETARRIAEKILPVSTVEVFDDDEIVAALPATTETPETRFAEALRTKQVPYRTLRTHRCPQDGRTVASEIAVNGRYALYTKGGYLQKANALNATLRRSAAEAVRNVRSQSGANVSHVDAVIIIATVFGTEQRNDNVWMPGEAMYLDNGSDDPDCPEQILIVTACPRCKQPAIVTFDDSGRIVLRTGPDVLSLIA